MKTRSSKRNTGQSKPYEKNTETDKAIDAKWCKLYAFALHCDTNAWIVVSSSPIEAIMYFYKELHHCQGELVIPDTVNSTWETILKYYGDYATPRDIPDALRFMEQFSYCKEKLYVECLTKPNTRIGWIPANF